ncbi:MAG: autotransporter domain-containing protein, partial [Candidatus Thioglobus sp.]|nr:autotransporter domain-containing protein [Candidatus Thioglobus sp.]
VTFDSAPDYETKSSYSFTATATDTAGNASTQSITITVTDLDEDAPTLSSSSPADGSNNFNASSNITLTFSEAVDAESGNITLKKTSDDSTVETFDVTSDISGSGSTTITINPAVDLDNSTGYYLQIASTAFDDSSSNSYAGISDTTTLNFTTLSGDSTGPTMTITASGASSVANGSTSDDATLTMTFTSNKATSNFAVDDITVSNGTLSSFSATSSTVYTATLTPITEGVTATVSVKSGMFTDSSNNANTNDAQFIWICLLNPGSKIDVNTSIKSMSGVAIDAVMMSLNAVDNRLSWLSVNARSSNLSHQGIRLNFANPTVDKLMNTAYVKPGKLELNNEFVKLIRNNIKNGEAPEVSAITDDTKQGLSSVAYNEFAKVREDTIDKVLNATSNTKVMGDWNVWTEGRITVGKTYSTSNSSAQDSETQNISLGFDRIIKDDNQSSDNAGHIVGVVLGIGKSDADTTNNSTVDADSYSLSAYGVIRQNDKDLAQAIVGYGHINVDKTRIDGSDTLIGAHDANQFFTSLMFKQKTVNVGSFSLSPYGKLYASRTWYDGYSETGGATALTYGEQTIDSTVLSAGVDADYLIPIQNGNIRPFMKFEYGADVSGSSMVNMHYNNETTNYQLELDNKADSNWKFVLGADLYTKDEWDSSISYERTEAVDAGYSDSLAVKVGLKF